jgi:hypothetical protein
MTLTEHGRQLLEHLNQPEVRKLLDRHANTPSE